MSEILSGGPEMSSVAEAKTLLRRVAGPKRDGENLKRLIERTARTLGWRYSRTKDVWYEDARRIDAAEMDRLREEAASQEQQRAIAQLVAMRDGLATTDSNFHRPTIDALDCAIRSMGGEMGSVGLRKDGRRNQRQQQPVKQYRVA